jgi:hypothetical protein
MDFNDPEGFTEIEEKAKEYEEIFEEIQNFEISEEALDKIEEVLDENISLKQENLLMVKQLEEMEETLKAQNFQKIFSGLKNRQLNFLTEPSEDLHPENDSIISDSFSLSSIQTSSKIPSATHSTHHLASPVPIQSSTLSKIPSKTPGKAPPPPPSPAPISSSSPARPKSKFRPLFWKKLEKISESVFEGLQPLKIRESSLNKFPISASKSIPTACFARRETKTKVLDYNREILVSSAVRVFAMPLDSVIKKLETNVNDLLDSPEIVKALSRVLPSEDEVKKLESMKNCGEKLSVNENFLHQLSKMTFLPSFLECAVFKFQFGENFKDLQSCFENWKKICVKIRSNKRLQLFLNVVLVFGNELNENNAKYGQAKGFDISILNGLSSVKSPVDGSNLLEVLIEEFFNLTGNPHIFHKSEHVLLKEVSSCSFNSLMESYEEFFKEFCKFSSLEFGEGCSKFIKEFVKSRTKDVQVIFMLMNETKEEISRVHQYFAMEKEETDADGKFYLMKELALFFDKYLEGVCKRWNGLSNRDSRRFTRVAEKVKSK